MKGLATQVKLELTLVPQPSSIRLSTSAAAMHTHSSDVPIWKGAAGSNSFPLPMHCSGPSTNRNDPSTKGPPSAISSQLKAHWVGDTDGETEGASVGLTVGLSVGVSVGLAVGLTLGDRVGDKDGLVVGETVGLAVGLTVGPTVGLAVGEMVGDVVGSELVGEVVGDNVAHKMGCPLLQTLSASIPLMMPAVPSQSVKSRLGPASTAWPTSVPSIASHARYASTGPSLPALSKWICLFNSAMRS